MKRIAIVGSGHLGQQIAYHIHQDTQDKIIGFFDEYQKVGTIIKSIPVLGGNDDIVKQYESKVYDALIIAVGYKHMVFRSELYNRLKEQIPFYTFIHSSAIIDPSAIIGAGTIIYPGCLIDKDVEIGNNVLLNVSCTIAHDSIVGDNSFLSPRVAVAGFVNIGSSCIIGINSTIIDNINIVSQTQLGGGTVLIKSIENLGLYVGNPARFIR
jgi:sugar O-acyltransferase (sialic acid O-acetyltransferase NeuD family)